MNRSVPMVSITRIEFLSPPPWAAASCQEVPPVFSGNLEIDFDDYRRCGNHSRRGEKSLLIFLGALRVPMLDLNPSIRRSGNPARPGTD
jgi:hypothetical protein